MNKSRILTIPGVGRYGIAKDAPGGSGVLTPGVVGFSTKLEAVVIDGLTGKPKKAKDVMPFWSRFWNGVDSDQIKIDLGSGKLNEQFIVALAKDWQGTTNNKAAPFLAGVKYMESGTGTTTETAYDYGLQTAVTTFSSSITPTFSIASASNNVNMVWQGQITYSISNYAITEWGLFNTNSNGSQYNTSSVTFTGTTITPGTGPSWTNNQWAGYMAIAGSSSGTANNSGASYYGAFIESNSSTALTIAQASNDGISYYVVNNNGGAGGPPTNNTRFDIWPFMADHKTFSALNVVGANGDSITFNYTLTPQSGG